MNKQNANIQLLNSGGLCNTPPRNAFNNILIDYLSFTWTFIQPSYDDLQKDLIKILNIKIGEICDNDHKALYGYKSSVKWGLHILFQFGLKLQDGRYSAMLQLSGQAVRDLEKRNVDFLKLFNYVIKTGGKCTRFDIAYDDYSGEHCDIFKILDYVIKYNYVSSIDSIRIHLELSKNSQVKKGSSLTFGKSKIVLQIYDKLLERNNNNYDVWVDFWHRYEIRFKEDIAHTMLHKFRNILKIKCDNLREYSIIRFYFSSLYQILDIKEFSNDNTLSRVPTVKWWSDFIGDYSKIKIRSQFKTESTIITKRKWIKSSVIKPLTKVALASANEEVYFKELQLLCNEMKSQLDETERLQIKDYKENDSKYIKELSFEEVNEILRTMLSIHVIKNDDFYDHFKTLSLSYKFNNKTKENIDLYVLKNIDHKKTVDFISKIIS